MPSQGGPSELSSAFSPNLHDPLVQNVWNSMEALDEHFHFMAGKFNWMEIKTAAQASKERFDKGEPLSKLDGIPFIVKDEMSVGGGDCDSRMQCSLSRSKAYWNSWGRILEIPRTLASTNTP